jgi:hypothetical protein
MGPHLQENCRLFAMGNNKKTGKASELRLSPLNLGKGYEKK